MIGGLEYHYKAFLRLIEQQKIGNFSAEDDVIHEIVAYLNRLGQFYYFAKSDFVCGILKSTPDMVEIKKILPLRMKNTAHRSYDDPRREDTPELMALQSFGMLSLQNFIPRDSNNPYELGVDDKASKWRKTFQGVQIPLHDGEVCEFFLETDHPKIIQEAFDIFSQVLNKGLEST
jgi:hypothetical protein